MKDKGYWAGVGGTCRDWGRGGSDSAKGLGLHNMGFTLNSLKGDYISDYYKGY